MNIDRVISRLKYVSSQSTLNHRIGCLILNRKGIVISTGYNLLKSHPIQYEYADLVGEPYKIYLHAEVRALIKCKEKPHHLYTMRLSKTGDYLLSKPCCICVQYIKDSGVKYISYTDVNSIITIEV